VDPRYIVEGCIYLLAFFVSWSPLCKQIRINPTYVWTRRKLSLLIIVSILLGLVMRGVWLIELTRDNRSDFAIQISKSLNQHSLCAFFLAFLIVSVEWVSLWMTLSGNDPHRFRVVAFYFSSLFFLVQLFYILLAWMQNAWADDANYYSLDTLASMMAFTILSFIFFLYGTKIIQKLRSSSEEASRQILQKVTLVAKLCTSCFAFRTLFWIYGSLAVTFGVLGDSPAIDIFSQIFYPTFLYTIPEIVSSFALLYIMIPHPDENEKPEMSQMSSNSDNFVLLLNNDLSKMQRFKFPESSMTNLGYNTNDI